MRSNVGTIQHTTRKVFFVRCAMYFFSLIVLSLSFTQADIFNTKVYAQGGCDTAFLSANGIYWSNPCAVECGISSTNGNFSDSSQTSEAVFKYLISNNFVQLGDKPMNAYQAAGFLGNFYVESKYDPQIIQSNQAYDEKKAMDSQLGGYAFGLAQWDKGRRVALINYAEQKKASGVSKENAWKDLAIQLNYLKGELDTSEKAVLNDSQFVAANDVKTATVRVSAVFERAGDPNNPLRIQAAEDAYSKYSSLAPSVGTAAAGGCGNTAAGNGDIVSTAEDLSWTMRSSEKGADHTALQAKPSYTKALGATGVNSLGDSCSKIGNSCDAFVATVMRYSGVDTEFPCCGANSQNTYMKTHTDKYKMMQANVTKTDELQPGYILWRDGHIKIYLGDGKEAAASHCQRTAEQSPLYLDGTYYAYMAI